MDQLNKTLNENTGELSQEYQNRIQLGFMNVNVQVNQKGKQRAILDNISGVINPGELTVIMGPSGSGKTTLLNFLSGRRESVQLKASGSILLNRVGVEDMEKYNQMIAYIQQDDILLPMFTPRELLLFAAQLRLQGKLSNKQKRVDELIRDLGLERCADTIVGNNQRRGISGGERKRTSIGVELITNPQVIFLDEPTTGLDSETALKVIQLLKSLSQGESPNSGKTVVATIHQPSSVLFSQFDKLILICQGNIVYHGTALESINYFSDLQYQCPENCNPADYYMRLLSPEYTKLEYQKQEGLQLTELEIQEKFKQKIHYLTQSYINNQLRPMMSKIYNEIQQQQQQQQGSSIQIQQQQYQVSLLSQFGLLVKRVGQNELMRSPQELKLKTVQVLVSSLINILVFHELNRECVQGIQNRDGLLFFLVSGICFNSVFGTIGTYSLEKPIFLRETYNKSYSVGPYFFSKSIIEIPLYLIWPLIQTTIVYLICGLNNNPFIQKFLTFYLILFCCYFAGSAYGLFLSVVVPRIEVAASLAPVILIPLIAFSGFWVNTNNLAPYLKPLEYLSIWKYGYQSLQINEYSNISSNQLNCNSLPHPIDPLQDKNFQENLQTCILCLLALGIFWRVLSYICMTIISKPKKPQLLPPNFNNLI